MDSEFWFGWFRRLSPGDTLTLFVLIGFMVVVSLRYGLWKIKKKGKRKKKAKGQDGSGG